MLFFFFSCALFSLSTLFVCVLTRDPSAWESLHRPVREERSRLNISVWLSHVPHHPLRMQSPDKDTQPHTKSLFPSLLLAPRPHRLSYFFQCTGCSKQLLPGIKHQATTDSVKAPPPSLFLNIFPPLLVFLCLVRDLLGPLALTPAHVSGPSLGKP